MSEIIFITKIINLHVRQVLQCLNYWLLGWRIKQTLVNVLTRQSMGRISLYLPRTESKIKYILYVNHWHDSQLQVLELPVNNSTQKSPWHSAGVFSQPSEMLYGSVQESVMSRCWYNCLSVMYSGYCSALQCICLHCLNTSNTLNDSINILIFNTWESESLAFKNVVFCEQAHWADAAFWLFFKFWSRSFCSVFIQGLFSVSVFGTYW